MSILRSYAHLFTRYRLGYAFGMLVLLVTNAAYMAIPRVFGVAVDAFEVGATRRQVLMYGAVIVALAAAQAVTRIASRIWVLGISRRVEYDLKELVHARLVRLAPSFYNVLSTGDLMSRLTNDVMLVRAMGGPGVLYFANAVVLWVLGVGFMVTLSWQLTLVVVAPLPLMAWIIRGMAHRMRAYAVASRESLGKLNTTVQENLAGAQVVRSFDLQEVQAHRFKERSQDYVDWALKESWTRAQMIPLVGLTGGLSYVGVLGLGAPLVAAGRLSLGDLVAFISYVAMLAFPTVAFGWILSLLQRGSAALERLDQILQAPETIASPAEPEPLSATGGISVRGLTFRYADAMAAYRGFGGEAMAISQQARRAALLDVDLEVKAGEFVALVGRVGSGKSTLLRALLRLVEVPDDTVYVGDADINRLDLDELRSHMAYVPQDDFLFSTAVSSNIAFGDPSAGDEDVSAAAGRAGLDPETSGLARGLETEVGERGLNLSGGQRQRVALARALVTNAPILVLDNALSNVDTETERLILAGLTEERKRRSVIVSSNRITAVQDADRIYVMDAGQVIEVGRHDELIARPGLYAAMHKQQQISARLEQY